MSDGNTTQEPGQAPATETRSETDPVLEKITAHIDARFSSYTSKLNGELAALRRGAKNRDPSQPDQQGQAPTLTLDDLKLSREIGRLESSLGEEAVRALGEEYDSFPPATQAALLRALSKAQPSRGAMPNPTMPNARASAALPREAVVRPRTQVEFAALRKSNPTAYRELVNDPTFDMATLPFR